MTLRFAPDDLEPVPGDRILAVNTAYKADTRPEKLNAAVGIYYGPDGKEFIFPSVEEARKSLDFGQVNYLNASGEPGFIEETAKLLFGENTDFVREKRMATLGTVGGTNALAMLAEFLLVNEPDTPVIMGRPAWANHEPIFRHRKLQLISYPHLRGHEYNFEAHLDALQKAPSNSLVFLQAGLTHNPTGVNPRTTDQWRKLAQASRGKRAFFDAPYIGFGEDLSKDTEAIRIFIEEQVALAVAVSYSKNAGLYKERVGALIIPTETSDEAKLLQGHLSQRARAVYSTPPAFGERVVAKLLKTPALREQWEGELEKIVADLQERRRLLAAALGQGFEFVAEQHGLFSLLFDISSEEAVGKTALLAQRLAKEKAIYLTEDGRINIGGIPVAEVERFGREVKAIYKEVF